MGKNDSAEIRLTTPGGDLRIRSFCSPSEIGHCTFDRQFAFHDQYKSLYPSRELLENTAEQPGTNVVVALIEPNHIIGYGVLAYADARDQVILDRFKWLRFGLSPWTWQIN